jgi:hypothetical protein
MLVSILCHDYITANVWGLLAFSVIFCIFSCIAVTPYLKFHPLTKMFVGYVFFAFLSLYVVLAFYGSLNLLFYSCEGAKGTISFRGTVSSSTKGADITKLIDGKFVYIYTFPRSYKNSELEYLGRKCGSVTVLDELSVLKRY